MPRIFIYDGKEMPDPDDSMSVDEVRQSYTEFFPELSNASHTQKKDGDNTVVTFQKRVGTKGKKELKKNTPSNCKFKTCHYNSLPPPENSQECIYCEGNKDKNWQPIR